MTSQIGEARAWAETVGSPVRLADLERLLLTDQPEILEAVEARSRAMAARRRLPAWRRVGSGVFAAVGAVAFLAPVVGVAVYGEHRYLDIEPIDASVSVPFAVWCFVLTGVTQLAVGVGWILRRAPWSPAVCGYGAVSAVLALFAAVGVPNTAESSGLSLPSSWTAPIWASVALGVLLVGSTLTRVNVRPAPHPEDVDALLAALPRAEGDSIRADTEAALDRIYARGLLTADEHEVARRLGVGYLSGLDESWSTGRTG